MSNSIWHDRYVELPEDVFVNSVRPCVIAVDENKKFIGACYGLRGSIPEIKYWAIVDDLIAQADKAERSQKAVDLIANMEQRLCIDDPVDILDDVLKIATNEIKQLIKETTNDK